MNAHRPWLLVGFLAYAATTLPLAAADQAEDEASIRANVAAYVEAYNKEDAAALAGFWSPDAVYVNPLTQSRVAGREEIQKEFEAIFAGDDVAKLEASVDTIEFISPNVAVEYGTAHVIREGADPEISRYSAVHVRRDGKWLMDRVTEEDATPPPSNYEHLKALEWLIGDWVDGSGEYRIDTKFQWTKNNNFMLRSFSISQRADDIELSGMQMIGWDAANKQIRSWVFDSDGGFGEATWTNNGDKWIVNGAATLADGRRASSVNTLTKVDDNSFTWQSSGRTAGGELLPNIAPVEVKRAQ